MTHASRREREHADAGAHTVRRHRLHRRGLETEWLGMHVPPRFEPVAPLEQCVEASRSREVVPAGGEDHPRAYRLAACLTHKRDARD